MTKPVLRFVFLVSFLLTLSACFGPKSPQEVTQAFWSAVLNNDANGAVKYSTLADKELYDGLSKDWTGYQASWGRVTIDGDKANIVSEFTAPANSGHDNRKFVTYLVKQNDAWKVDYDRTKMAVHGGALGNLLDKLGQLGNELSKQMDTSADRFKLEMDRMSKKLEQMADSFNEQASKSIDKYAEELRKSIQQLEDSINRALRDDDRLSDHDKQVLQVAAGDLEQDREQLQKPSVQVISNSSRNIGATQQKLDTLNGSSMTEYKKEWRDLTQEIQKNMQKMLDELSSPAEDRN